MEINCGQVVLTTLSDPGILERADNCSNVTLAVKYFVWDTAPPATGCQWVWRTL